MLAFEKAAAIQNLTGIELDIQLTKDGKMVVIQRLSDDPYQSGTEVKDVHKIANDEKLVPREWMNEDADYVTDEFVNYVRPLIQGDVSPVMVDGIPRHLFPNPMTDGK